jgi:hypothetical protein
MAERHRSFDRGYDRGPGRGRDDRGRPAGGPRGGGFSGGGRGPGGGRDFSGPPPQFRERRPPAPPEEAEDFEEVDADLAIAILDTATRLTEIVGTAGLPDDHQQRRQAVLETFETLYFSILSAITGGEDEAEGEEE